MYFGADMYSLSMFCKGRAVECVFPFTHEGTTYDSCTADGSAGGSKWCATKVDADGNMVENFWGECDMSTCREDGKEQSSYSVRISILGKMPKLKSESYRPFPSGRIC